MSLYVRADSSYELPPEGLHSAVCVDVVDEGFKPTQFGDKHKVRFVFQIEERNSKDNRHTLSAWFNLSMHENASMRDFLQRWRGRVFTDAEINRPPGFDLESVVGKPATVNVVHNESNGKTYANIDAITPHSAKLGPALEPENYIRKQDREEAQAAGAGGAWPAQAESAVRRDSSFTEEDDIPF